MQNNESRLIDAIRKKGCRGELFALGNNCIQILFEDQVISYVKEGENKGYYLRMIDREGRMGQIAFTVIDNIEELIDSCLLSARFQKKTSIDFEESSIYKDNRFSDPVFESLSGKELITLGNKLIGHIRSIDENIKGPIYLEKNHYDISILTADNAVRSFKKGRISLEIEGKLSREGDLIQFNRFYSHSKKLPDVKAISDSIKNDYSNCSNIVSLPSGKYTVILDPEVFEDISRPIEALFNGRNIEKKTSALWDKMGMKIFDERINICDDPGYPFLENSVPFDDEGVISQRLNLVNNGIMSDILLDKESSSLLCRTDNGRGFKRRALLGGRTYDAVPQPSITNLFLKGGDMDIDSIFRHSEKAVYIKSLMGTILGHHISGYVSGNVWLGFFVENGKITGRIKDVVFSINVLEAFRDHIAGLSREVYFNRYLSSPYILLKDIQLTSK